MSFEWAIQSGIYGILSADTDITSAVTGVFDDVKEGQEFPYVVIGESILNNWSTDGTIGRDASITIHSWSGYEGRKEIKIIQGLIDDALDRKTFTSSGYDIISIDNESTQSFLDVDGETRHGVSTYRVLIQKNGVV